MIYEDTKIFDHLRAAIDNTVCEFQKHTEDFLSERDIQAWLFAELRRRTIRIRYMYEVKDNEKRFKRPSIEINPVRTEYFPYQKAGCCFDIAILSGEPNREANIWHQPCRIGIEIKLWQACEGGDWEGHRGPQPDLKKLQDYKSNQKGLPFTGIAMLFVHPRARRSKVAELIFGSASESNFPDDGVALLLVNNESCWWKSDEWTK